MTMRYFVWQRRKFRCPSHACGKIDLRHLRLSSIAYVRYSRKPSSGLNGQMIIFANSFNVHIERLDNLPYSFAALLYYGRWIRYTSKLAEIVLGRFGTIHRYLDLFTAVPYFHVIALSVCPFEWSGGRVYARRDANMNFILFGSFKLAQ